jgi:hypothetical protein
LGKPRKSFLLALLAGLVTMLVIGGGLYAAGVLDKEPAAEEQQETGSGTREASSPSVRLYEGAGYSVEIPRDWEESPGDPVNGIDVRFTTPSGAELLVVRSQDEQPELPDDDDTSSGAQQVAFDLMINVELSVFPDSTVVSREQGVIGAQYAERVTFDAPIGGQPGRVIQQGMIHGKRLWMLGVAGTPDGVTASLPDYDKIVTSFEFAE